MYINAQNLYAVSVLDVLIIMKAMAAKSEWNIMAARATAAQLSSGVIKTDGWQLMFHCSEEDTQLS